MLLWRFRRGWRNPFRMLRAKWHEVPWIGGRVSTAGLLTLPDAQLLSQWEAMRQAETTGLGFASRGWYRLLYANALRDKTVLDVGSGLGFDALTFAEAGTQVTCLDVAEPSLAVISKLAEHLGVTERVRTVLLCDPAALAALPTHDVIWAVGSLHHAPYTVIRDEVRALVAHLGVGGRWIQLAYPKGRWVREGSLDFSEWGRHTDGEATPWAEWYDLEKLMRLLAPASFDVVLSFEFHGGDYIWFDLVRRR